MILVKKFRIFILVVGLCGNWIHPSQTQTLMCADGKLIQTCTDDKATPNCGVETLYGNPKGCVDATDCPDTVTPELVCQSDKKKCCCIAVAGVACNDLYNNPDQKEKACKLDKLKGIPICAEELSCHDDSDNPLATKCQRGYLCGAQKADGKMMGCAQPLQCPDNPTSEVKCDDSKPFCCCNADNCNTKANVCKAAKGSWCSETTSDASLGSSSSTSEQSAAASATTAVSVSVESLVCIGIGYFGLSHHIQ